MSSISPANQQVGQRTHQDAAENKSAITDRRTQALLEAPILPTLGRLAAPNIFLAFMQGMVSLADIWFISRIGTNGLAGIALVFPLVMLMHMMSAGAIGGAVSSAIARALGAGDRGKAEQIAMHAFLLAVIFGLLFTTAMILSGPSLFEILGGKGPALTQAVIYATIIFGGAITVWFCNIFASILRGTGNMMVPAVTLSITAALQILLCGALVLGFGPIPGLGIAGAAISAVCTFGAAAICFFIYIITGRSGLHVHWLKLRMSGAIFRDILGVGLISSLSTVQTIASTVIVTGLVGTFGTAALAGYGLGMRLELLQVPIIFAIGSALVPMIGVNTGAGNVKRARRITWTGAGIAACITGGVGVSVALWPGLWADLFSNDPGVLHAGYTYLHIVGGCYMFLGIGIALFFASQGAGKVLWPVLAGSARFLVAAAGGFVLVHYWGGGLSLLFMMIGLGMIVSGVGAAAAVKWLVWRS
jgi:putative MATE family efflux protein